MFSYFPGGQPLDKGQSGAAAGAVALTPLHAALVNAVIQFHQQCQKTANFLPPVQLSGNVTLTTDSTASVKFYTNQFGLKSEYRGRL